MKTYKKGLVFTVLAVMIAGTCLAGETLKQFDGIQGRDYHSEFYEEKSCDVCHDNEKPLTLPDDYVCLNCHDQAELVAATARPDDERLQNPHDNMHYGTQVPCMECHGEHDSRQHMCAGCHSFDYPNFKE